MFLAPLPPARKLHSASLNEANTRQSTPVLIIDSDRIFCRTAASCLADFAYAVKVVHTGLDGVHQAATEPWQAVILNAHLPDLDGMKVLECIRRVSDVPVLMIDSLPGEDTEIASLAAGADAYMAGGGSARQLHARLHALTRRAAMIPNDRQEAAHHEEIVIGKLHILPEAYTASLDGQPLALTASEFGVLLALARARGRVKTREHLCTEVFDRKYNAFDRGLDVHVSDLRKKLGDHPKQPHFIRTIHSIGYMFIDPEIP